MAGDGKRWRDSPELIESVRSLHAAGKTSREIATELGVRRSQIDGLIGAKGWSRPTVSGVTATDTMVDVGELMRRLEFMEGRAAEFRVAGVWGRRWLDLAARAALRRGGRFLFFRLFPPGPRRQDGGACPRTISNGSTSSRPRPSRRRPCRLRCWSHRARRRPPMVWSSTARPSSCGAARRRPATG